MTETAESDAAFEAAEDAIAGARRDVNRMHALLPRNSRVALHAAGMVVCLSTALDALRDWPPEPDEVDDEDEYEADWSGDPRDYHPIMTPISEEIDEARMWRRFGLDEFGRFIRVAPTELRGGIWPTVVRVLHLPARGSRRVRAVVRRRQNERRHREQPKALAARRTKFEREEPG